MSSDSMDSLNWEPLSDEEIKNIVGPELRESDEEAPDVEPVDWSNITFQSELSWYVDPRRFRSNINPKMFHDGLPHKGPLIHVDERIPAELNHIEEDDRVLEIAKNLGYPDAHKMELVVEVVMNDFSTIYIPFRATTGAYRHEYLSFLCKYVPQMRQWLATVKGCEPDDIVTEYDDIVASYNEEHERWIESIGGKDEVKHGLQHLDSDEDKEPEVRNLDIDLDGTSEETTDSDFSADDLEETEDSDEEDYDWMDW